MTLQDRVVATRRQQAMYNLIPSAHLYEINADHDAVFARAEEFVPLLVNACLKVHTEAEKRLAAENN